MRRAALIAAPATNGATVTIDAPAVVATAANRLGCRARFTIAGPMHALLPLWWAGYPFVLAKARVAFLEGSGLEEGRLAEAMLYLGKHDIGEARRVALEGVLGYAVTRDEAPFLLDWRLADPEMAAAAGRLFGARLAAVQAAQAAQALALARASGFDTVAAMRSAQAARRQALATLKSARGKQQLAMQRLQFLMDANEELGRQIEATRAALNEQAKTAGEGGGWEQQIRRESFAAPIDLLAFSNMRVVERQSVFGTPEVAILTDVVNFSSQTLVTGKFHVVVWHTGVERYFEDQSLYVYFGRGGLAPGGERTLYISLNGLPGIGLAFVGDGFDAPGERHAFLFVNSLRAAGGRVVYEARWDSPIEQRASRLAAQAEAEARLQSLAARAGQLAQEIERQREAVQRAQTKLQQAAAALPAGS